MDVRPPRAGHFVKYTFLKLSATWRALPAHERTVSKLEFAAACESFGESQFLRAYSLVGSRGDADLMLRVMASRMEPVHEFHVLLNQSRLMQLAEITHSYLAVSRESRYVDEARPHVPRPGSDRPFLMVYPMVKRREWYGLPQDERRRIMQEHIDVGRAHGSIEVNTAYSFGIDDQEFVVAFDAADPRDFVDVVEALRGTEASRYTERETPIFTCLAMSVGRALAALDGVAVQALSGRSAEAV
jgi:chlorite dismutase